MFEFLKSKKSLGRQQHDELVAAVLMVAQALHSVAANDELPDSRAALQRNFERAEIADAANAKAKALLAAHENSSVDLLYYRCLYHAASLGTLIGVWDLGKRAAAIRSDMQSLRKRDRSSLNSVRVLYEKSFRIGFVEERDGAYFVPQYAMPFRPEVIFDP